MLFNNTGKKIDEKSDEKSDENFKTCSLKSFGRPVPCTGQFFCREMASFLFCCLSQKEADNETEAQSLVLFKTQLKEYLLDKN